MRVKQEALAAADRKKLKSFIEGMDKDEIVNYLGSLDYVFTYLRDIDMDPNAEAPTIQTFVENHIRWQNCLSDYVRQKAPFSTIHLKYIINLYELLEECVFDQVLRDYVKKAWCEESFSVDERKQIIERFISSTYAKTGNSYISSEYRLLDRYTQTSNDSCSFQCQCGLLKYPCNIISNEKIYGLVILPMQIL